MNYVGAIDQGTTSTRFAVVDRSGRIVAVEHREHRQIYPHPGLVEHDPEEIRAATEAVVERAIERAGIARSDLAAVGITNQRETTIAWNRVTGAALHPGIVWQDTRTAPLVERLALEGGSDRFRAKTGLPLATYFSGPKMRWMLDEVPDLARAVDAGDAVFGTIDSWLLWHLTGEHLTDPTNASRTMLMALDTLDWDDSLCSAMGVPRGALPAIRPSVSVFGEGIGVLGGVPVAGVLGDQQAALFGQTCFEPGTAKNTYGTGCFLLLNTGERPIPSTHGLLTTVAYVIDGGPAVYALEGSVAIAGAAVQWLRDGLGIVADTSEVERLASQVSDNGGVYFVPAFNGLFAPYWRADARGVITGLTRYATAAHLARATLEATAYQTNDVVRAMEADSGVAMSTLFVDGGMVANELLMQFQADVLGVPVARPVAAETTVLGAAFAAGLAVGFFSGLDEIRSLWTEQRRWEPSMDPAERGRLLDGWHRAVEKAW